MHINARLNCYRLKCILPQAQETLPANENPHKLGNTTMLIYSISIKFWSLSFRMDVHYNQQDREKSKHYFNISSKRNDKGIQFDGPAESLILTKKSKILGLYLISLLSYTSSSKRVWLVILSVTIRSKGSRWRD